MGEEAIRTISLPYTITSLSSAATRRSSAISPTKRRSLSPPSDIIPSGARDEEKMVARSTPSQPSPPAPPPLPPPPTHRRHRWQNEIESLISGVSGPLSALWTGHTYSSFPSVMFYIVQVAILAFYCPPDAHFHCHKTSWNHGTTTHRYLLLSCLSSRTPSRARRKVVPGVCHSPLLVMF